MGLGVLVPQRVKDLGPEQYQAEWEAKAEQLLQEAEDQQPGAVRRALEVLGPDQEMWDLSADSLRSALGNLHSHQGGLGKLLRYLHNPSPEAKESLLDLYPQEEPVPSPQEQLQEQQDLNLVEFLQSL